VQQLPTNAFALLGGRNNQVMNEAATTVVAAQHRAYNVLAMHSNAAKTRIASKVRCKCVGLVGSAEPDALGPLPEGTGLTDVALLKRLDGDCGVGIHGA